MTDPHESFTLALTHIERYRDLVDAVVAIAAKRRATPNSTPANLHIEAIAANIRSRVPHLASRAALRERGSSGILAYLHQTLFEDLGLGQDAELPLHPDAGDINLTLETGRGLPIVCALIYCAVAERLGIEAFGIDSPGHFLVGVFDRGSVIVIDAFGGGREIDHEEFAMLIHAFDEDAAAEEYLQPAAPNEWIDRWLRMLVVACDQCGEEHLLPVWSQMIDDTSRLLGPRA